MSEFLKTYVLGHGPRELAVQFLGLYAVTVLTIYQIIWMRRSTVVVMSHQRVLAEAALMSLLNLGVYHIMLWLLPPFAIWKLLVIWLGLTLWGGISNMILHTVDQDRSIRDTVKGQGALFNCNWPLIRRCANHALMFLVLGAIILLRPTK